MISHDGMKLVVIENGASKIHVYDTAKMTRLKVVDLTARYADLRVMHHATVSPDTKLFVQGELVVSGATTVVALDINTLAVTAELQGVTGGTMIFFNA